MRTAVKRIAWTFVLVLVFVSAAFIDGSAQAPASDLVLSDLDRAQLQILDLSEQLRIARAQRASCETTLGPIEMEARAAENQRARDDLKRAIEARHPGTEYDAATGTLKKKPEPPKK